MAVINEIQWARIHAKAWAEPFSGFKDKLDVDPYGALDPSGTVLSDKLIDLGYYYSGLNFGAYNAAELLEIFTSGTLHATPVTMDPSEWVRPSGATVPIQQNSPPGISLPDWARIYAYIWYQYKFATPLNKAMRDHFEMDPANTLNTEIIPGLNSFIPPPPFPP